MEEIVDPEGIRHRVDRISELSDEEIETCLEENREQFMEAMERGQRGIAACLMGNYNGLKIEQVRRTLEQLLRSHQGKPKGGGES